MPQPSHRGRWYWEQYIDDHGRWREATKQPPGQDLAAMLQGLGRLPGSVPPMWPLYRTVTDTEDSPMLRAEHAALCLYGMHQQSQRTPMHTPGPGLGESVRRLSTCAGVSAEAVTRRFNAAATATSADELVAHLRGLVTQLRAKAIPTDYTHLLKDLLAWPNPTRQSWVRRRWGMQYHRWESPTAETPATT